MKYECKLVATGNKVYQSNEMGKHNGAKESNVTRSLTVQLPTFTLQWVEKDKAPLQKTV